MTAQAQGNRLAFAAVLSLVLLAMPARAASEDAGSGSQELVFKVRGERVRHSSLEGLMARQDPRPVAVIEPHEGVARKYLGFRAVDVLDAAYGKHWRQAEEVLFTCRDGYQPSIPVSRFLKHEGYFVDALQDERGQSLAFRMTNRLNNNEVVSLGPYYLVWENVKDAYVKMMGANDWPYQVTTVDLIRFADRFPKMSPPASAGASARRGFEAFRQFCANCHKMNGEGGDRALDLNVPPIVARVSVDWLSRWISDPRSLRPESKMPGLNPKLPERARAIADIIAYLKAMASR